MPESHESSNFLRSLILEQRAAGQQHVITRFPPEPNGYPHIGHAKSICLNFGLAQEFGGVCHLRMDDTNPTKESQEYVDALARDVRWLGFDWGPHFYHASDYFEDCYRYAEQLVIEGRAYVDSQSEEEIRANRGTISEPGRPGPYRDRSAAENLDLLRRMRAGEFPDGAHVLRAKGDLAAANLKMRDPLLYRIRHAHHHRSGDAWCIYPMYDYAHPISDAAEGITHSICTLEFENNRDIYDWVIDNCRPTPRVHLEKNGGACRPRQYEFARLALSYTVVSKRKLLRLVQDGRVSGWDDPRMPTLAGLRRRGVRPEALRLFCERIGVAKANSTVDLEVLEGCVREDLNLHAPRRMAVLRPLKVEITTWPADKIDRLDAPEWPPEQAAEPGKGGARSVPFTRELYIERDDFAEDPPKGFRRLAPGREVRLRYGYIVRCDEVIRDEAGQVIGLRCSHDPDSRSGAGGAERKVAAVIHWVSATENAPIQANLYDRLFSHPAPDAGDEDFLTHLNPASLEVVQGFAEASMREAAPGGRYQLERLGYFYHEPESSTAALPILNRIVGLRDGWAKDSGKEAEKPAAKPVEKAAERPARPTQERALSSEEQARVASLTGHGISAEDALKLATSAELYGFFEAASAHHANRRGLSAWISNDLQRALKDRALAEIRLTPAGLAGLVAAVDAGRITGRTARELWAELLDGADLEALIRDRGLEAVADTGAIDALIDGVLAAHADKVAAYRAGKAALLGFFVGTVMKASGGRAAPGLVQERTKAKLEAA